MGVSLTRRDFLAAATVAGVGLGFENQPAAAHEPARVSVCNPLLRTPLSLIIADSCPVIDKADQRLI